MLLILMRFYTKINDRLRYLSHIVNYETRILPATGEEIEKRLANHRAKKEDMKIVALEFAKELKKVCFRYSNRLEPGYSFIITTQDFEEGVEFYNLYRLVLCDSYYPEKQGGAIELQ